MSRVFRNSQFDVFLPLRPDSYSRVVSLQSKMVNKVIADRVGRLVYISSSQRNFHQRGIIPSVKFRLFDLLSMPKNRDWLTIFCCLIKKWGARTSIHATGTKKKANRNQSLQPTPVAFITYRRLQDSQAGMITSPARAPSSTRPPPPSLRSRGSSNRTQSQKYRKPAAPRTTRRQRYPQQAGTTCAAERASREDICPVWHFVISRSLFPRSR